MRKLLVLAALVVVAPASAAAGGTSLHIAVWPQGAEGAPHTWTLRCAPARGTLPHPGRACERLLAADAPFAPTPKGTACTMIYGGPQMARVTGTFRGHKVWTTFRRRNGCETARWNKVAYLLR
jgi:Subtilisin inhibitor-like